MKRIVSLPSSVTGISLWHDGMPWERFRQLCVGNKKAAERTLAAKFDRGGNHANVRPAPRTVNWAER